MPDADVVRVQLLGPVSLVHDSGAARPVGGVLPSAVFAMLALRAGSLVTTEQLIDGVWGEEPPPSARNALQVHVSALRKQLSAAGLAGGAAPLVGTPVGYTLSLPPSCVDALVAERMLKEVRLALLKGESAAAEQVAAEALKLWAGPVLSGVGATIFVDSERHRLRQLRLSVVELAADAWLATGRHAEVVELVETGLVDNPFHEGLWRRLMLALHRDGRSADALAAYDVASSRLREELGLDPGPELSGMQGAILRSDPSLRSNVRGADQSSEARESPGPASPAAATLPFDTTKLVGRTRDVRAVGAMFTEDGDRMVTLLGPGGIGKTRLAVEVARGYSEATGRRAAFVDLTAAESVPAMMEELVRALGGRAGGEDPVTVVAAAAQDQGDVLVVLDNLEQIAAEAGPVLIEVLAAAPTLSLLLTSRVALNVAPETRFVVGRMLTSEAVALFLARARSVAHRLAGDEETEAVVSGICQDLDGLPLAIELAAARLRVIPLVALRDHLRSNLLALHAGPDASQRHRTLSAAIAGSIDLLDPATAAVLARLSIFRGGFTFDAASEVVALDTGTTADHLEQLIDSSLVNGPAADDINGPPGPPRFTLLEPIRQYLATIHAKSGDLASSRARHAAFYLRWFTEGEGELSRDRAAHAVASDLANLDVAVRYLNTNDADSASLLLSSIYRRMTQLGRLPQLLEWVEDLLACPTLSPRQRAELRSMRGHISYIVSSAWPAGADDFVDAVRALVGFDVASFTGIIGCAYVASHLVDCGRLAEAGEFSQHGIRWARLLGQPTGLSTALNAAQYVASMREDVQGALDLGMEALALVRWGPDRLAWASALSELVCTLVSAGRADEAQALVDETRSLLQEFDGPTIRWIVARTVGRFCVGVGRFPEAVDALLELHRFESLSGVLSCDLGWTAFALESVDPAVAATVLGAAQSVRAQTGDPDVMPPALLCGDFEARLEASFPDHTARGARLGWLGIQAEVTHWNQTRG